MLSEQLQRGNKTRRTTTQSTPAAPLHHHCKKRGRESVVVLSALAAPSQSRNPMILDRPPSIVTDSQRLNKSPMTPVINSLQFSRLIQHLTLAPILNLHELDFVLKTRADFSIIHASGKTLILELILRFT
ncbi:hypothetical protein DM860_013461 [Cuscuta australis]|uniref:Uncharacterized protein n=1 Tax=Cuscuta australis TaxID=267555 RepID=A0A328D1D4_9ASTE|nr:hypothetical protein DM860_013461 [Cuscuta australis]